ncbi:MAG: reverse transcriptase domain-containing protein [Lachnospiraceae bacterium]|nr:reverse transcriptase domain-containing protein [Lachnospiraceae bacterium]
MGYTQNLEDVLFEIMGENDEDYAEEQILEFLNNADRFRDFGQGLTYLTRKYMPDDTNESEEAFLKRLAKEKGISLNRNTIKSWFQGVRPKKGEQSRQHMYKICFALGLSMEDIIYLFKNIYFDQPFNMRNYEEFIYFYCLNNGYTIDRANQLIERVKENNEESCVEGTIYTEFIGRAAKEMNGDEEVIEYIISHPHNFSINNRSAAEELEKLIGEIRPTKEEEEIWKKSSRIISNSTKKEQIYKKDNRKSYLIREIALTNYDSEHKDENAVQFNNIRENTYPSLFAKAYVAKRGIYENAKAHMYNDLFLKMDISNFFASIDHDVLKLQLYREIKHAEKIEPDMDMCAKIVEECSCGYPGLPLGLVSSPDLANVYLKKFDSLLYGKLKSYPVENIIYTRYADDMIISFKFHPKYKMYTNQMKADVIDYLKEFKLDINEKKTSVVNLEETNHVRITGLSVTKAEDNYRHISVGKKLKNEVFWDAIRICDSAEDRDEQEVKELKGMMSFILSVEKQGISFSYSRNMVLCQDLAQVKIRKHTLN